MPQLTAKVIADSYTAHGITVLRVQENAANEVDRLVTALHRRLARLIMAYDPASSKGAARYVERRAKKLIAQTYARCARLMEREQRDVVELETKFAALTIAAALRAALEDERG